MGKGVPEGHTERIEHTGLTLLEMQPCVCVCVCVCVQKPPVLQVGSQSDSSWGDWKDVRVRSDGVELSFRRVKLECSQVGCVWGGVGGSWVVLGRIWWALGVSGGEAAGRGLSLGERREKGAPGVPEV